MSAKLPMTSSLLIGNMLLVLANLCLLVCDSAIGEQRVVEPEKEVAALRYSDGNSMKDLVATIEQVEEVTRAPSNSVAAMVHSRLVYLRVKRFAVRSAEREQKPDSLVWQGYDYYFRGCTRPSWQVAIALDDTQPRYVVVVRSAHSTPINVRVFRFDPAAQTDLQLPRFDRFREFEGPHTPPFGLEGVRKPPKEAPCVGEFSRSLELQEQPVSSVGVRCKDSVLIVALQRDFGEGNKSPAFDVVFDLKTGNATYRETPVIQK